MSASSRAAEGRQLRGSCGPGMVAPSLRLHAPQARGRLKPGAGARGARRTRGDDRPSPPPPGAGCPNTMRGTARLRPAAPSSSIRPPGPPARSHRRPAPPSTGHRRPPSPHPTAPAAAANPARMPVIPGAPQAREGDPDFLLPSTLAESLDPLPLRAFGAPAGDDQGTRPSSPAARAAGREGDPDSLPSPTHAESLGPLPGAARRRG